MPSEAIQCKPLEVVVSDRGIERAIKMLKRKLASEGVLRELKDAPPLHEAEREAA